MKHKKFINIGNLICAILITLLFASGIFMWIFTDEQPTWLSMNSALFLITINCWQTYVREKF